MWNTLYPHNIVYSSHHRWTQNREYKQKNLETGITLVIVFIYSRALDEGGSLRLFFSLKKDHLNLYASSTSIGRWIWRFLHLLKMISGMWGSSALPKQCNAPASNSHQGCSSLHCFFSCLVLGFVWFGSFLFCFQFPSLILASPTPWGGQLWESFKKDLKKTQVFYRKKGCT